jgi:hypothetical protein
VDTVSALLLGAETDDGLELDDRGFVLLFTGSSYGSVDACEIRVTVIDMEDLPAI